MGFHDVAGAGFIHLLGGTCGLIGSLILGPRAGIFDKASVNTLEKEMNQKKRRTWKKTF